MTIFDRRRNLQRQGRLRRTSEDLPALKKHASLPTPGTSFSNTEGASRRAGPSQPTLQKHSSHPPMAQPKHRRAQPEESPRPLREVTATEANSGYDSLGTARASHTPAMRSGPPLSCNFCWNTVDECGRILRRKTQYHCPECRTNLCIVPCFHEYHDGTTIDEQAAR